MSNMSKDILKIKVTSSIDYLAYREFLRFSFFKGRYYKAAHVAFLAIPLAIAAALFTMMAATGNSDYLRLMIIPGFLLIVYACVDHLLPMWHYRKYKLSFGDEIDYRFYDEYVEVEAIGGNVHGTEKFMYYVFKNIYEIDSAFYLVLRRNVGVILPKSGLSEKQVEYLSKMFRRIYQYTFKKYI
jgi:hypothetical protein